MGGRMIKRQLVLSLNGARNTKGRGISWLRLRWSASEGGEGSKIALYGHDDAIGHVCALAHSGTQHNLRKECPKAPRSMFALFTAGTNMVSRGSKLNRQIPTLNAWLNNSADIGLLQESSYYHLYSDRMISVWEQFSRPCGCSFPYPAFRCASCRAIFSRAFGTLDVCKDAPTALCSRSIIARSED